MTADLTQVPSPARFLALGDSYTVGEAVSIGDGWPAQLAALLRDGGIAVAAPEIIARTGWTTDELARGIDESPRTPPYDLVSLLIGVNNQYRGRSAEEYGTEFPDLLERAVACAGQEPSRVIVLSIPDWGVTPFAEGRDRSQIARAIDAFNAAAREESISAGASYVDITGISRQVDRDPGLIASDGLHPSAAMYAEWARLVLPTAREILQSRAPET